ncbi:TetR/AcrR family transcriptional regulator C-terminal domain-containing protein [Dickeya dianthicola]|uniref:TetR/AcrR family transcriptional regulator C-terminal domain-containing protein n=1 Tax=Dickeya dianthicola TaxID=204039 RepID=UPI00241628B7|nr:TetR/AcrR family transcriptional regulator C-terminal domain-containing protein [Dickeya dianthicola]
MPCNHSVVGYANPDVTAPKFWITSEVGEAGHSDIGALFQGSGPKESMSRLADLMADAMQTGELAQSDPMLRAMQFTSLVKAEADAVLLQRELPDYSTAQVKKMVRNGVQLFLHGASSLADK